MVRGSTTLAGDRTDPDKSSSAAFFKYISQYSEDAGGPFVVAAHHANCINNISLVFMLLTHMSDGAYYYLW